MLSFTVALLIFVILWLVAIVFMRGENLGQFDSSDDSDAVSSFTDKNGPSEEHGKIVESIRSFGEQARRMSRQEKVGSLRRFLEGISEGREHASEFVPVDADGVPAEWVLAPGADPLKRVLYIHGGAFMAGSHRSHRNITNRFSEITGAAVLAIDYRLMPENRRRDGIGRLPHSVSLDTGKWAWRRQSASASRGQR